MTTINAEVAEVAEGNAYRRFHNLASRVLSAKVREQPHPVLAPRALVTGVGSAPGGAAPFAATRE